ncbi:MAG: hypothetical protein QG643_1912 [Pseudomonadota bacterium]|jgi:hypothetical protein|nr:hypothetical protein [Pseudomonadota bacterium]
MLNASYSPAAERNRPPILQVLSALPLAWARQPSTP